MGFSVQLDHAVLSSLWVKELYNAITIKEREVYWGKDETRNRMYPQLFMKNIQMLVNLIADLQGIVISMAQCRTHVTLLR